VFGTNGPMVRVTTSAASTGQSGGLEPQAGNTTRANLTDGNLGENGILAVALTNPLFVDVDGGGWTAPGLQINP
jgi:hypothetical protein